MIDFGVLIVGLLVAANCALVGSYLVLRRAAMLGDAISHAVLPGIVLAFLLTGHRSLWPMVLGAAAFGVLTVFLVDTLNRSRRLYEDASIGVVFPALFSLGVILVSRYAGQVDLDLDCVLFGEIAYTSLDQWIVNGWNLGPRAAWVLGGVLLVNVSFVTLFYKELKLSSFDAELSSALGFSPTLMHYLLMGSVALTVVSAFESVGAILVVALLIVPPATAVLLTHHLSWMLAFSIVIGFLATAGGYGTAIHWDSSIAGSIAAMTGMIFLLVLLLAPRGVIAQQWRRFVLKAQFDDYILLLQIQQRGRAEHWQKPAAKIQRALLRLQKKQWIAAEKDNTRFELTAAGEKILAHNELHK